MFDTREPDRPSKTFSRSYVAPLLQAHLDGGGTVEEWLAGRTPLASMARISADQLDGEAIGVGRQHKNNTRNAAKHGCAVVLHYEDNNITAAKREVVRPAFVQMVRDLTHGEEEETKIPVHGCISVERERVWRMPRDFVAFQDALIMNGTGIHIEEQSKLDLVNDDGTIIAALAASGSSEAEVKRIRKRTTRNARDRAEEGKLYGGPRRFGWLGADKETGRPGNKFLNPEERPHVVDQFAMRYEGKSWRSITAEMNRRRVLTARGNKWSEQAVKTLVTNPALWGGRVLDGKLVVDEEAGAPITGAWETPEEITYEKRPTERAALPERTPAPLAKIHANTATSQRGPVRVSLGCSHKGRAGGVAARQAALSALYGPSSGPSAEHLVKDAPLSCGRLRRSLQFSGYPRPG